MTHAETRARLLELVRRIFADGMMNPGEKDDLRSLLRTSGLSVADVREVFATFAREQWGEVIADGVVTREERERLATIVRELKMPTDVLPEGMRESIDPKG